jgi:cytochrome c peroxidase
MPPTTGAGASAHPIHAATRAGPQTLARWAACLGALLLALVIGEPVLGESTTYTWNLPVGFPVPKVPDDNPMSVEKVELGRFLFYDVRLSGNQTQACASCHQQARAFTDGLPRGIGSTGELHPRGSMSLGNVAYASTLTWANPVVRDLEIQALVPMFGEQPVELGLAGMEEELLARLEADGRYRRLFAEAFPADGDAISLGNITRAIAAFQRTLISGNAPYDRYINGLDDKALSASAIRGGNLYFGERFECFHCHGGFNLSGSITFQGQTFEEILFENNGLYNIDGNGAYPVPNRGLFEHTHAAADMGRFKPPTLRNIAVTAPYMHDGSIATLEEVLEHYAAGGRTIPDGEPNAGVGHDNPYKNKLFIRGFEMSAQEKTDMLTFLESFTDQDFLTNPRFSDPFVTACPGDCDLHGTVTVDEIVTSVGIALGTTSLAACVGLDINGDGDVDVAELIGAVNFALGTCPLIDQVARAH